MREITKTSDRELIALYLGGDARSMEILISRYQSRVYTYIRTFVNDSYVVDDIFQETFIKAIQMFRAGSYKEEGKFYHWITTVAHNLVIDYYRKVKRDACVGYTAEYDKYTADSAVDLSVEDKIIANYNKKQLTALVDMLPPEQCEVVKLRHYCDLSFKDIATLTNVSINTALGRMRYALINLRRMIEEKNITLQQ